MSYFDDAKYLIDRCKSTLEEIKKEYETSLHEQTIKPALLIDIKNFMENLRSALDFTAHGLFDIYGDDTRNADKISFPYAWEKLDIAGFKSKNIIDSKIPGIINKRPDIGIKIESYQHFASQENLWLPKFMALNNENKHQKLTSQIRKEVKELKITSGNVGMTLRGNASIRVSGNASIRIGNVTISDNQNITPENPADIKGKGKQEIITWVSFLFVSNNEPVLPLLNNALMGVNKIVSELSSM